MLIGEDSGGIEESFVALDDQENVHVIDDSELAGEISINALTDSKSMGTLRLQGSIKGKRVSILIDSNSTHNSVDFGIVKTLGITTEVVAQLLVTVAMARRQ